MNVLEIVFTLFSFVYNSTSAVYDYVCVLFFYLINCLKLKIHNFLADVLCACICASNFKLLIVSYFHIFYDFFFHRFFYYLAMTYRRLRLKLIISLFLTILIKLLLK